MLFKRLLGLDPQAFHQIVKKVRPAWEKRVLERYKGPGRHFKLTLEDMLLMLLLYDRTYTTQMFIGYLFGIDDSRVCRLIQRLEPLLAKVMAIPKERSLSRQEVESLIMDATEQPIERPQKGQKRYDFGKKKRHTLKTEIRTTLKGKITYVWKSYPGSCQDYNVYKHEDPLHPHGRGFVDSGYQGLDQRHIETELPYKATKTRPLDKEEKAYNRALSRMRVVVENVMATLKTFKILSYPYRHKRKRYNLKFKIIAGIVNLNNGFAPA